jgi:ABC-type amino acid transport substrate-binding protein
MKEDIDVGIGCITVTDERAKSFDFSDSYKTVKLGYIHSKSKKMKQVKKIGFQIGSTIQTHIDKKYEVQGFHDVFTMFEKLKAGEIDAIAVEEVLFNQNLIDTKKFAFHDIKGAADKYAFAVKKGNTEVLNAINKAIKSTNGGKNPVKKVDAASAVPAPSNEEKKPSTDKTTKAE